LPEAGVSPASPTDKPRQRALSILQSTERGGFADPLLDEARRGFNARDSAFILELVYGVLRNRARLDWTLDRASAKPVSTTDAWTRNILRLGAYQLLFLDRVPHSAAVNTSTELAKQHGKKSGYVNGLLRTVERNRNTLSLPSDADPAKRFSVHYSHPEWLVLRWLRRYGVERTEAYLRENNRPSPLVIRTNTLRATRDELKRMLVSEGADARETAYSPVGLELLGSPGLLNLASFRNGLFLVQDEAAQLIGMMLAPEPGESVLDACAAPGGKATHIAGLMGNQGALVALDNDPGRMARVRENSARLGTTIIRPVTGDAATYHDGPFDRVLVDAPCSGLGVLRRHPDGRWTKDEKTIGERQAMQMAILENCAGLLKPGGVLVYATCTTEPEENEAVVGAFVAASNTEFRIDDPRPHLQGAAAKLIGSDGFLRTFPDTPLMDGFFGARLIKRA
jgi:16S rRNA (cytosine967-C5)-methyltransferase